MFLFTGDASHSSPQNGAAEVARYLAEKKRAGMAKVGESHVAFFLTPERHVCDALGVPEPEDPHAAVCAVVVPA